MQQPQHPADPAAQDIPNDIYQPLLKIARSGYDANDVKQWYLTMLRHVRRIGTENAEAAYDFATPVSDVTSPLFDSKVGRPEDGEQPPVYAPAGLYISGVSPGTDSRMGSNSPSCESYIGQGVANVESVPSQQVYHLSDGPAATTTQPISLAEPLQTAYDASIGVSRPTHGLLPALQLQTNSNPLQPYQSNAAVHASWNHPRAISAEFNAGQSGALNNTTFAHHNQPQNANQWFGPNHFNSMNTPPPAQYGYPNAPYQTAMSSTAMPVLIPYEHSPPADYPPTLMDNLSTAFGFSIPSEMYSTQYLPAIPVIPSRKRRNRMLQKGVKKITEQLQ